MKKLVFFFVAAGLAAVALSCTNESAIPETVHPSHKVSPMTFLASSGPITRTSLEDGTTVVWDAVTDSISVFDAFTGAKDLDHNRLFKISEIAPSGVASFSGTAGECATYYAAYPYDEDNYVIAAQKVRIAIPAAQTVASAGTFGSGCNPSAAVLKDGVFTFYNVGGLLKFTLTHDNVTSLTVTANDGGAVAGEYLVAFNGDGSIDEAGTTREAVYTSVTLSPASEATLAAGTYYLVVSPRTYEGGINMVLHYADGTTKNVGTTSDVIVRRSKYSSLGTIKTVNGVNFPVAFAIGWDAENDKGFCSADRDWIALWKGDPASSAGSGYQKVEWTGEHGKVVSMTQPQAYITWNWADAIVETGVKHFIEIVNNKANKIGGFGVKGIWTGDYYEFAIPVNSFPAGTTLRLRMPLFTRQGPAFWKVLYLDGAEWKDTSSSMEATDANSGSYTRTATWILQNGGPIATSDRNTAKTVDMTFANAVSDDYLHIRVQCVDGSIYYSNDDLLVQAEKPVCNANNVANATFYFFNPGDREDQDITISVVTP